MCLYTAARAVRQLTHSYAAETIPKCEQLCVETCTFSNPPDDPLMTHGF